MTPRDAARLIADAVTRERAVWADFGSGDGTFTRALASLLGPGSRIYAVDRNPRAITALKRLAKPGPIEVISVLADFTSSFALPGLDEEPGPDLRPRPQLDGMLFGNALHFIRDPGAVLARLVSRLRPGGRVVIVEYDRSAASRWVPYPIPVARLPALAREAGLSRPAVTAKRPSQFGGDIYTATADQSE